MSHLFQVKPSKASSSTALRTGIDSMIPSTINLKIGAQVMLLRNRISSSDGPTTANEAVGYISVSDDDSDVQDGGVVVRSTEKKARTRGGQQSSSSQQLVNGSRGKVIAFTDSARNPGLKVPTVLFDNGVVATIGPMEYSMKGPAGDGEILRYQIPLKLAW
jgi:hypothetical protein